MGGRTTMADMKPGEEGVVERLEAEAGIKQRMQDLGLVEGTRIQCVGKSPLGDPAAYQIRNTVIAFRKKDVRRVFIKAVGP